MIEISSRCQYLHRSEKSLLQHDGPAYWHWILLKSVALDVASISMVGDELKRGDDELAAWARDNPDLFISVHDEDTQANFVTIANLVVGKSGEMKPGAAEEFLAGADPWLIAKAMASGATVVTQESFNRDKRKKFLIPNICEECGVSWMNTFDMLYKLEARFVLAA